MKRIFLAMLLGIIASAVLSGCVAVVHDDHPHDHDPHWHQDDHGNWYHD